MTRQIWKNYKNGTSESLSIAFLAGQLFHTVCLPFSGLTHIFCGPSVVDWRHHELGRVRLNEHDKNTAVHCGVLLHH